MIAGNPGGCHAGDRRAPTTWAPLHRRNASVDRVWPGPPGCSSAEGRRSSSSAGMIDRARLTRDVLGPRSGWIESRSGLENRDRELVCIRASATNPWTTSRRSCPACSSRVSAVSAGADAAVDAGPPIGQGGRERRNAATPTPSGSNASSLSNPVELRRLPTRCASPRTCASSPHEPVVAR